jgi:predicted ferric reductase
LLGLAFGLFHALILIGDKYINYTLMQILVPFNSVGYKPIEVGLGQVAFYVLAIVSLSFYVRKRIGHRTWRVIHFLSFLALVLALAHGLLSGTDSTLDWLRGFYFASGASLLFLTLYRIIITVASPRKPIRSA